MTQTLFSRAGSARACFLTALAVAGCGDAACDVSGRVTCKGIPLVCGTITLIGSDGVPHQGNINSDGIYEVAGVPPGKVKVAVVSPNPDPRGASGGLPPDMEEYRKSRDADLPPKVGASNWRPINQRYGDPDTSGLTLTVHKGQNRHDFTLK